MKKVIFIFFVICIFGCLRVYSFNNDITDISEEILPIRDEIGILKGINCVITIPSNYNEDVIEITPDIFGAINEYSSIRKGDFLVNIKIINNSNFDYEYLNDSFFVSTEDIKENWNYVDTGVVGFEGKAIYDLFVPYRVKNSALLELFPSEIDIDLTDEKLDFVLKKNGYSGVEELNEYYLDYYNKKYFLSCDGIRECSDLVTLDIFTGEESEYLETNNEIIGLAYDNFYNKILNIGIDNKVFSIGDFMKEKCDIVDLDSMIIKIDSDYMTNAYKDYQFIGTFGFSLKRI